MAPQPERAEALSGVHYHHLVDAAGERSQAVTGKAPFVADDLRRRNDRASQSGAADQLWRSRPRRRARNAPAALTMPMSAAMPQPELAGTETTGS